MTRAVPGGWYTESPRNPPVKDGATAQQAAAAVVQQAECIKAMRHDGARNAVAFKAEMENRKNVA